MKPFYRKGRATLHIKVKKPDGSWSRAINTQTTDVTAAENFALMLQTSVDKGGDVDGGPLTVRTYGERWIKGRHEDGISTANDEDSKLRLHIYPHIGSMPLGEVRPRHIIDLVKQVRRTKRLISIGPGKYAHAEDTIAPRTVRNIITVAQSMFRDAVREELILASPVVLNRKDLPKKRDKDPEWRTTAIFTRSEIELLISDERIPQDRRVFYALMFLTASRFGEAAALRWRHYDTRPKPLGRISVGLSYDTKSRKVKETKAQQPRTVPAHHVLAAILAEWKLSGYATFFGDNPKPDDLIVPSRQGDHRSSGHGLKKFHQDLARVGLRRRRQHDTKRTFKTIALDDGANESRLSWITHGRKAGVDAMYDEPPWGALCEVVQAMRIQRRNTPVAEFGKQHS
jgi:integrase